MKKIWPWLLLLLLLILLCIWTKKDSIYQNTLTEIPRNTPKILTKNVPHYINYQIQQLDGMYVLDGNLTNETQQNILNDAITSASATLKLGKVTEDNTLIDRQSIPLLHNILPHFIKYYKMGKIVYKDNLLEVYGNVSDPKQQEEMKKLLQKSTLSTRDYSHVVASIPIDFIIIKDGSNIDFRGTFEKQEQINTLYSVLPSRTSLAHVSQGTYRIDNGAVLASSKILPLVMKTYSNSELSYREGKLYLSGMVDKDEDLKRMEYLLAQLNIPVVNHTIINPVIQAKIKRLSEIQKEKENKLAQEKANRIAEEKAIKDKAQATLNAKKEQEAKALAQQIAQQKIKEQEALERERARLDLARERAQLQAVQALNQENTIKNAKKDISELLSLGNIEFQVAKTSLTEQGKQTLDKLATVLSKYPDIDLEIAGHTDSDGSAIFNQKLSQSRVDTVKEHLVIKGIPAQRLTAKGYGESNPLVPNTSNANKQKNRRVELNIQGE